jgi:hypothetical protein
MQSESVEIPDPFDKAAATAWADQVRTQIAAVGALRARLAQIDTALGSDAARQVKSGFDAAQGVLDTATAERAHNEQIMAEAQSYADGYKTATRDPDQSAMDAATLAVSEELTRLMATSTTSAALTATIDGLALRARYRAALASSPPAWNVATIPFLAHQGDHSPDLQLALPVIGSPQHAQLVTVLDMLDQHVDAVADLVTAEGVHQLVGGNLARSGAALEIASSGTVTDQLEVARTPVTAQDLTHRVLLLGAPVPPAAWAGPTPSIIAAADPGYVAWLSTVLPDPARVHLAAAVSVDGAAPDPAHTVDLSATVLGLDPSDWLRVSADPGELLARVAVAALPLLESQAPLPAGGRVVLTAPVNIPADGLPIAAMLAAAGAARTVMASARAVTTADLTAAGQTPDPTAIGAGDLAVLRVTTVQAALRDLDTALATTDTLTTADMFVTVLLDACRVGLAEAAPPLASGPVDLGTLRALAAAARRRLAPRLALPAFTASSSGADATLTAARELLPTLCGGPVPLLIPVAVELADAGVADLTEGVTPIPGAEPADVRNWLSDHARVRPSLAAVITLLDIAETVGADGMLRPRVTQLPRVPGATWAGADPAPAAGIVDLVALRFGLPSLPQQISGLYVDSWVQTIPDATSDAGVAFHFDEPNADPPQAVLVAVSPDVRPEHVPASWDVGSLVEVVTATMALARDRAVAADLVPEAHVRIGTDAQSPRDIADGGLS